ncbi:NADH:flavin oxidoreductase/NADH oxidase [Undibacterium sp. SXout7W]|uniref:NADH:flavin oxidoreductase/NADH oxidase n=1 Tax=Undibacterium sp. SXout7W TaxID=3413049 RepID=UPI003BEFF160
MSALFSPTSIGSIDLKNRIVIAPMCQYSASGGNANSWHLIHLGNLALSGAGLLIIEATAVEDIGRISPWDLGLWSDENESALAQVLSTIRQHSSMPIGIQLAHAGRKASSEAPWNGGQLITPEKGGWETVAPSAISHAEGELPPSSLDLDGLARIKTAFVNAAIRAHRLGIEVIELHAAHGYLLHQFLSPLANQRTDQYGGVLENRMRFPLEIFDAIRAALPEHQAIGVRISATDWVEHGWNLAESMVFTKALEQRACSYIHVSSGGVSPLQKIPLSAGYQVDFATQIRKQTKMPVITVGLITEAEHAEEIVASGQADMVAIARGILFDPHWPWHAAAKLGATVEAPRQYWRSQPRELKSLFGETKIGQR